MVTGFVLFQVRTEFSAYSLDELCASRLKQMLTTTLLRVTVLG
jgi:hypothetical protein